MAFVDLSEVLDADLSLPYKGKTYVVPPVDAETGLRFQRLAAVAAQAAKAAESGEAFNPDDIALDDDQEADLFERALGPVYDEMLADRVPWPVLKVAGMTAWLDAAFNRETAEAYWNAAGSPNQTAGNRTTRRAADRSTRRQGSASGTTRTRSTTTKATATRGRKS
ncbi:hypothetical protein UK23_11405 [Lentzea aerocolonigenes]|uniref:DUF7426 domain-containing protein n=1 Tax=Lentzea aerocolonigenes TaxID=68170 RepID=A0A0F0H5X6_LENAE|nr:hypothetical protein [Lentzea aerocolonigenes]KJK50271.1 hypothetical protein UK23_11405 [Lentzea aerocolonigenes]